MSDPAAYENQIEYYTDMPVGEILRRTRMHYGQSLEQVEMVLRIRASQLDALESGDLERLPGRVYAIGFVRSYAEYLGLDGDKIVHLFKAQSVGSRARPELQFPAPASESKVPNTYAILGSLVAAVLVIAGWATFLAPPRSVEAIPAVPAELQADLARVENEPLKPRIEGPFLPEGWEQAAQAPSSSAAPNRITLEITDSSWVEIRNASGAAILRQVLKAGDIYLVPDEPGLVMATGNAGGITVKVDGKPVPPIGRPAEVKRNLALDPVSLLKTVENNQE